MPYMPFRIWGRAPLGKYDRMVVHMTTELKDPGFNPTGKMALSLLLTLKSSQFGTAEIQVSYVQSKNLR